MRSLQGVSLCNLRTLRDTFAIFYQNTTMRRSPAGIGHMYEPQSGPLQNKNNPDAQFAKNNSQETGVTQWCFSPVVKQSTGSIYLDIPPSCVSVNS